MRNFILTHENMQGEIELRYDLRGYVYMMEIRAELKIETIHWILQHYPITVEMLRPFGQKGKFEVMEQPDDMSFDAWFYNFPGAQQNKARAMKVWDRMTKAEKVKAIWMNKSYARFLSRNPNIGKKWADGYLNGKNYNNDYNTM